MSPIRLFIRTSLFTLGLFSAPSLFAYSTAGCQSSLTCSKGTVTCQASSSSDAQADFTDSGVCGTSQNIVSCYTLRRFDRGERAGTEAQVNRSFICCDASGSAIAVTSRDLATKLCQASN